MTFFQKPQTLLHSWTLRAILWILSTGVVTSCGGGGGGSGFVAPDTDAEVFDQPLLPEDAEFAKTLSIEFDPRMPYLKKVKVLNILKQIKDANLEAPKDNFALVYEKYFTPIFGNQGANSVLEYVTNRINVLLYERPGRKPASDPTIPYPIMQGRTRAQVLASNVGIVLWFNKLAGYLDWTFYQFGRELRGINNSRDGVIKLHPAFFRLNPLWKAGGVLVHEATHSNCNEVPRSLIDRIQGKRSDIPVRTCGHLHVECPESADAELRGLLACDTEPWGAYGIGAFWTLILSKLCPSCSKNATRASVIHLFRRIYSEGFQYHPFPKELIDRTLPLPDMTRSERINESL